MREQKTRLVAKVTMRGEYRVVYETASAKYVVKFKEYDPWSGWKTRTIARYCTLAQALYLIYSDADKQRV